MKKDGIEVAYYSYIKINRKMYFSHIFLNGLFEMDLDDFSVKFLGRFPEADSDAFCLHGMGQAIKYKNNIYFFPLNCRVIHCYNLEDNEMTVISIPMKTDDYFLGVHKYVKENKVWLFSGVTSNGVIVFDLDSQSIIKDNVLSEFLSKYEIKTNYVETPDGKLYTCCLPENTLIEINIEKRQIKEFPIHIDDIKIGSIHYQKGTFWFIDKCTGSVYKQQGDQYMQISVVEEIEWIAPKEGPFAACRSVDDKMYVLPGRSKYIMKIEADRTIIKAVDYPKDFCFTSKYDTETCHFSDFGAFEIVNDKIWLHPCKGNQLLIYDTKSNQITGQDIYISTSELFPLERLMRERERFSIDYLCSGLNKNNTIDIINHDNFGEKIYETICSEI